MGQLTPDEAGRVETSGDLISGCLQKHPISRRWHGLANEDGVDPMLNVR